MRVARTLGAVPNPKQIICIRRTSHMPIPEHQRVISRISDAFRTLGNHQPDRAVLQTVLKSLREPPADFPVPNRGKGLTLDSVLTANLELSFRGKEVPADLLRSMDWIMTVVDERIAQFADGWLEALQKRILCCLRNDEINFEEVKTCTAIVHKLFFGWYLCCSQCRLRKDILNDRFRSFLSGPIKLHQKDILKVAIDVQGAALGSGTDQAPQLEPIIQSLEEICSRITEIEKGSPSKRSAGPRAS